MRALARDRRGYPVPFNVLRDSDGLPHFTVNDSIRQARCLKEKRCAICGARLGKPMWFVGGPRSAFHKYGAYLDSALHHECMTYALRVCPWLAAPKYLGRIDDATVDYTKLPEHAVILDYTQIAERPVVFVAVGATGQTIMERDGLEPPVVKPSRPYVAVEYWQHGEQLPEERGQMLAGLALNPTRFDLTIAKHGERGR
jgi:hypothetical protein